eukprot:6141226-Prymnesium_polylepis.3
MSALSSVWASRKGGQTSSSRRSAPLGAVARQRRLRRLRTKVDAHRGRATQCTHEELMERNQKPRIGASRAQSPALAKPISL